MLGVVELWVWAIIVSAVAMLLVVVPVTRPSMSGVVDIRDLAAIATLYIAVVATFRLAFGVFTQDNVLGLFLSFAAGLIIGVVGPIIYQVWIRGKDLRSLGIGLHRIRATLLIAVALGLVQFAMTLSGYELPEPVDWVPLLVMSLVVGFFEAIFFRGFIQNRLQASFGDAPGVAAAAALYAVYHIGYGMGPQDMWFLFGLGLVYAVAFRLVNNILVLWPLLTPLGSFFNNLEAGDIELPWASILGFVDVAIIMAITIWLAHRHIHQHQLTDDPPDRIPAMS